jgi:hypothetical protein
VSCARSGIRPKSRLPTIFVSSGAWISTSSSWDSQRNGCTASDTGVSGTSTAGPRRGPPARRQAAGLRPAHECRWRAAIDGCRGPARDPPTGRRREIVRIDVSAHPLPVGGPPRRTRAPGRPDQPDRRPRGGQPCLLHADPSPLADRAGLRRAWMTVDVIVAPGHKAPSPGLQLGTLEEPATSRRLLGSRRRWSRAGSWPKPAPKSLQDGGG